MITNQLPPTETVDEADALEEAQERETQRRMEGEEAISAKAVPAVPDEVNSHQARPGMLNIAGLVRGNNVEVRNLAAGAVLANNDVILSRGFSRTVFAGHNASLQQAATGILLAAENITIQQGGAQAVIAAGSVNMEHAGSGFAIARRVRIGPGGLTLFAISGSLEVAEGGKVLVGRRLSGVILATVAGVIGLLVAGGIRRRRSASRRI